MEQKIALVTGGSGGIGYAAVKRLVADRMFVYFTYNSNLNAAKEIEEEFAGHVKAVQFRAGVDSASDIVSAIKSEQGKLDVLVNNLGMTNDKLLIQMSDEDFNQVIDVNLGSTFAFTKAAVKVMSRKKYGKIVNVSSIVGVAGNIGQANYAASKAGMIGFTKSVAFEYARKNITVNSIAPGFVETEMTSKLSEEVLTAVASKVAIGRMGTSEEIANVISFLASDDSRYITAQNIIVDGGMH